MQVRDKVVYNSSNDANFGMLAGHEAIIVETNKSFIGDDNEFLCRIEFIETGLIIGVMSDEITLCP